MGTVTPIELLFIGLAPLGTCCRRGRRLGRVRTSLGSPYHRNPTRPHRGPVDGGPTSFSITQSQCQQGCLNTVTAPALHLEASKPRLETL